MQKAGSAVNFTGAGTTYDAGGDFYGYNPIMASPDEVGGVLLIEGDGGFVYGIYAANIQQQ